MFSGFVRFGVLLGLFALPLRPDADEIATFYFLVAVIGLSFFAKKVREVDMRLPGLFFFVACLSLAFNFRWPVRAVLSNLLVGLIAIKAIGERYDFDRDKTAWWLFLFCFANDILIVFQSFKLDRFYLPVYPEIAGVMWVPWLLGCAAVLCVPFLTATSKWDAAIVIPMLLFSHSKLCVLAAILVYCVSVGVKFRFRYIGFAVVAGLAYIAFFDSGFDTARFEAWFRSLRYLRNPLIGNGIGSWAHEGFLKMNGAEPYHWRWAHNEFFQVGLFETGLLGALSLLALTVGWFRGDRFRVAMALSLVLLSLFHPVFHFGKLLGLLVLIVAWLTPKTEPEPLYPDDPNTTWPPLR